eukprot:209321-Chlamydomonas_euryale.AAC.8
MRAALPDGAQLDGQKLAGGRGWATCKRRRGKLLHVACRHHGEAPGNGFWKRKRSIAQNMGIEKGAGAGRGARRTAGLGRRWPKSSCMQKVRSRVAWEGHPLRPQSPAPPAPLASAPPSSRAAMPPPSMTNTHPYIRIDDVCALPGRPARSSVGCVASSAQPPAKRSPGRDAASAAVRRCAQVMPVPWIPHGARGAAGDRPAARCRRGAARVAFVRDALSLDRPPTYPKSESVGIGLKGLTAIARRPVRHPHTHASHPRPCREANDGRG